MVSQELATVRAGGVIAGDGGTVGRAAARARWQEQDDGEDVFAEEQGDAGGGSAEPVEGAEGEELDEYTMLDSVIIPVIASVRP